MLELGLVNWDNAIRLATEGARLLAPEVVLVAVACAAILLDLVTPKEKSGWRLALLAVIGTFLAGQLTGDIMGRPDHRTILWEAIAIDRFACFFKGIVLLGTIFSVVLVYESRELQGRAMGEFYGLMFMAVAGMCLMVGANDMVTAVLSIELVSVPSFALVAYVRRDRLGTEASIKYVLYSAFATGCMLFGLSILFGLTGSTSFSHLNRLVSPGGTTTALTAGVGCLLAFAGFAFKMAAAPFHFWAPDVYQGAPTPVTAWLSVTSKAAGVGLFIRFLLSFVKSSPHGDGVPSALTFGEFDWTTALIVISALTMTIGNFGAIFQTSMKRLLAYSSVAHVGYILMGVAAIQVFALGHTSDSTLTFALPGKTGVTGLTGVAEPSGGAAAAFYLAAYLFMNLGAFACVIAVSNCTGTDDLSSFRALGRRAPVVAFAFVLCIFGLIGLPPTGGFTGKLQLFMAAIAAAEHKPAFWWLVGIAGLNSVVSVYYYLKIAKTMYFDGILDPDAREPLPVSPALTIVSGLLVVPVILLGVTFDTFLNLTMNLDVVRYPGG